MKALIKIYWSLLFLFVLQIKQTGFCLFVCLLVFNECGFQEKERLKNTLECLNDLGKTGEYVGKWRKEMN